MDMKSLIKSALGPERIAKLRKWFPSRVQQRAETNEVARKVAFYATFVKKGDICFDVGANVGNRIKPLLSIGAKVVAIEPQEKCFNYLKSKFGRQIRLVGKGLGAAPAVKDFHLSADTTISSFSDEWINAVKDTHRFQEKKWDQTVQVEMTTADELVATYGKPAFIKIDVEGYELEVLKGLSQPIPMISFEYTVPEQPQRAIQCIEQIEKHNNHIECNYSIGEDLVWAAAHWLTAADMKTLILSPAFNSTSFGDIYIRTKI
jgi:FkbM family methyltransferase